MKNCSGRILISFFLMCVVLTGCHRKKEMQILRISAPTAPHALLLEFVKKELRDKEGIDLHIIREEDYGLSNEALDRKEIDANFFEHAPYLREQKEQYHYHIQCFAQIHLEPMGLYSYRLKTLSELQDGAKVVIPQDRVGAHRALHLLQEAKWIELNPDQRLQGGLAEITSNPHHLHFEQVDARQLPKELDRADLVAIPSNFALTVGLNPKEQALVVEKETAPFSSLLVIREGEENDPKLQALKKALTSDAMKQYILQEYKGALVPVLKECQAS